MTRAQLVALLEQHAGRSLDDEADREALAAELHFVMRHDADAWRIREFFSDAPTTGARVATLAASHGKVWGEVLDAACRLAGVPS